MAISYRLSPWTPKTSSAIRRIYLSGPGLSGRSFLERTRAGVTLVDGATGGAGPLGALPELHAWLVGHGMPAELLAPAKADALWEALCQFKGEGRAAAGSGALPDLPSAAGGDRHLAPTRESQAGAAFADESVLDVASITVPGPIHILVDHREPEEIIAQLRRAKNCTVEVVALESGDYVLNGKVVVERKSVLDFQASVIGEDKRLFVQSEKMKLDPEHYGVILIEGNLFGTSERMSIPQISGALSYLGVIQGLSIIPSLGMRHSAYLLVKLAVHQAHGLGYELSLRVDKPKLVLSSQRYVLEGLPGVSAGLAVVLLRHFGTIQALACASEAQLRAVPGVGPTRAAGIRAVFTTPAPG